MKIENYEIMQWLDGIRRRKIRALPLVPLIIEIHF
jgi:hypothetical protein